MTQTSTADEPRTSSSPPRSASPRRSPSSYYTVNRRLLLITLITLLAVVPASYAWYRHQLRKTAMAFKARAEQLEQEKKWDHATAYYQRYLAINPDDTEALVKMVESFASQAPTPARLGRLNNLLYQALGRLPERHDLRRKLAENLVKVGNFSAAEREATKLLDKDPDDARAARKVIALARFAQARFDRHSALSEAVEALVKACEESPGDVELIDVTANTLREFPNSLKREKTDPATLADQLMDQMVAANPKSAGARIARHRYRVTYKLADAGDLKAALEIEPDNIDALLLSAAVQADNATEAQREVIEASLRRAIEIAPNDPRAYLMLGLLLEQSDHRSEAIPLLAQARGQIEDNLDLGLALAHMQISEGQVDDAAKTIRELDSQSGLHTAGLDSKLKTQVERKLGLLHARLDLAQGKSRQAIPALEAMLIATAAGPAGKRSSDWIEASRLLAQTHASLGEWDKAAEYYDGLAQSLPDRLEVAVPAVDALLKSGRFQDALQRIDEFARLEKPSGALLAQRVQALLAIQLSRAADDRNWTEFQAALQQAKAELPDSWQLVFAEIDYELAKSNDKKAAAALLRQAEPRFAKNVDFWRSAALAYQLLGLADDQQRALASHRDLAASPVDHAQLQTTLLARNGEFQKASEVLAELGPGLDPSQRRQIDRLKLAVLAAASQPDQALAQVKQLLAAETTDAELLKLGIEMALAANDLKAAEQWETRLSQLTDDGPDARYLHARRLLAEFDSLDAPRRRQLEETIAAVRAERPQWYPILALAAELAQRQGDTRNALTDYQLAVQSGDQRPFTLQQLAILLFEAGRLDEAEQCLSQLSASQVTSPFLDALSIEIAVRQDRQAMALELARKSLERYPDDPVRHLFLAGLLFRNGEQGEALDVLRNASKQFSDDPRVWTALITGLVQARETDEARKLLEALAAQPERAGNRGHFVAAQGYERLGDLQAARKQYELATLRQPLETDIRFGYARLLAKLEPRAAQEQLERILKQEPTHREAKRELAILLAATGREADWARAHDLLQSDTNDPIADAATNDRLRALLVSRKGRTRAERLGNCQDARKVLQERLRIDSGTDSDLNRLLLAQILETEASLSTDPTARRDALVAANDQLRTVIDSSPPSGERLSQYIEFLLRNGGVPAANAADAKDELAPLRESFLAAAELRLKELQRIPAGSITGMDALVTALSAQLLRARGLDSQAHDLVSKFVDQQPSDKLDSDRLAQRYLANGRLFASIGAQADAEKWYRKVMEISPDAYVLVVQSLVEQNKRREAAQLCLDICQGKPDAQMATLLANIMTAAGGSIEGSEDIQSAIDAALQQNETDAQLQLAEAVMRASRGDYDTAIKLLRQIIARDPNHSLALNNLATLLAETPNQCAEALQLIERAIEIDGRQASLLDTQGTILLKLGDGQKAIACLEEATASGATDARYYLHLAAAYQLTQRGDDARRALGEARALALEKFVLTADDRKLLAALEAELGSPSPKSDTL